MEKKIVFFDLDGTLLDEEKKVPESAKRAIHALQGQGIYTAISTGRSPNMFHWLLDELNIQSYVSMNGQHVIFEGEEIYSNPMDEEILHDLSTIADQYNHGLAFSNHRHSGVNRKDHPHIYTSYTSLRVDYPKVEPNFHRYAPVHQVQVYCERQESTIYTNRYADYQFIHWGQYASDMLPKGSSKAVGVQQMLDRLGIAKEHSYAFGDGSNDLEMIQHVGTGVAMGNAIPELKDIADLVTASCSEDGIAKALVELGLLPTASLQQS